MCIYNARTCSPLCCRPWKCSRSNNFVGSLGRTACIMRVCVGLVALLSAVKARALEICCSAPIETQICARACVASFVATIRVSGWNRRTGEHNAARVCVSFFFFSSVCVLRFHTLHPLTSISFIWCSHTCLVLFQRWRRWLWVLRTQIIAFDLWPDLLRIDGHNWLAGDASVLVFDALAGGGGTLRYGEGV